MLDTNSIIILLVSVAVINFSIVCVYFLLVLKDARETLRKVNIILDDTQTVVHNVANPLGFLISAVNTISSYFSRPEKVRSIRR
jgi:hypothetical protein